jgi:hypothetical protein
MEFGRRLVSSATAGASSRHAAFARERAAAVTVVANFINLSVGAVVITQVQKVGEKSELVYEAMNIL